VAGQVRPRVHAHAAGHRHNAPPWFRVNGPLRNLDAWYGAFGVMDGALYLPPEARPRIW